MIKFRACQSTKSNDTFKRRRPSWQGLPAPAQILRSTAQHQHHARRECWPLLPLLLLSKVSTFVRMQ